MDKTKQEKRRLDIWLVEQKLAPSRSRARDLIKSGFIKVNGSIVTKVGQTVAPSTEITLSNEAPNFVSRSAVKLEQALSYFEIEVTGKTILDVGSSTGGFTEVLLRNGAKHIYAIDVGHDQLHESLKGNPKITSLEGQDARTLKPSDFNWPIEAITIDVSFISLTKALETPLSFIQKQGWLIALIKPQFEVGKKALGKGGIVKNEAEHQAVIEKITKWLTKKPNWQILGVIPSPISGQSGNKEFLLAAKFEK